MNNDFFPTEDYKIPVTSNYMKLLEGANTFRVLSSAIVGYEYFNTEQKPVRSKEPFDSIPQDLKKDGKVSHFWAFVVWNYDAKRVQILELTQKTIQGQIKAYIDNKKWGSPKNYDITITRTGSGFDTEYQVIANPHTQLDMEVKNAYERSKINLEAMYTGADPFQAF